MTFRSGVIGIVVGAMVLTAGCATMSTGAYVARRTDFTHYRTFAWSARPIGDPRFDNNGIFKDYFYGAVERDLGRRGMVLVAASDKPDLLVHVHASVTHRTDAAVAHTRAYMHNSISVVQSEEGKLVLDMVEPTSYRLVFRGWAVDSLSGMIGSQDRMKKKVEEAVTRMLANAPAS
jgi:hypothetical protein